MRVLRIRFCHQDGLILKIKEVGEGRIKDEWTIFPMSAKNTRAGCVTSGQSSSGPYIGRALHHGHESTACLLL